MSSGIVKWFNNSKGFGFIEPKDGGEDILVHDSVVEGDGCEGVGGGGGVNYEAESGPKGMQATEVTFS